MQYANQFIYGILWGSGFLLANVVFNLFSGAGIQ